MNSADIETILERWRSWPIPLKSRPNLVSTMDKGLTNKSYLLAAEDELLTLRINAQNSEQLGINRSLERLILNALRDTRLTPELLFYAEHDGFIVSRFIGGRVWTHADICHAKQREKLKGALQNIQQVRIDHPRFDYYQHLKHYRNELSVRNIVLNASDQTALNEFEPELLAFAGGDWQPILCHHDLVAENIIETTNGLAILDWEYAAMGHPHFDERYIDTQALRDRRQLLEGDTLDKLIFWLEHLWYLLQDNAELGSNKDTNRQAKLG